MSPTAAEVEAVLAKRAASQDKPTDADLFPVYNFLLPSDCPSPPSSSAQGSSSPPSSHWYCTRTASDLHREAATYLIFLFAFRREGTSKSWVDALEKVVTGCEECARGFGIARRRFGAIYMGNYPPATRTNFFAAVDRWQGPLILAEHSKASQPTYGAAWTDTSLLALPTAVIQLLFNEPTLLDNADISSLLDATIASSSQKTQKTASAVTHLGLTPVLIRLLSSPDQARRDWASSQIPATVRRPLTFGEWCSLGIGLEIQAFYGANDASSTEERWQTVQLIVQSRSLSPDTVRKGLLGGITTEGAHGGRKGVMAVLSNQLGSETYFPAVLGCFSFMLSACPTPEIWAFDSSPELPPTLFAEIVNNRAFLLLLQSAYPAATPATPASLSSDNDKVRGMSIGRILGWMTPFIESLITKDTSGDKAHDSGFAEVVSKLSSFCLQEMQHSRFNGEQRAAVAEAGCRALCDVVQKVNHSSQEQQQLKATIDVHSKIIASIALRRDNYPDPTWSTARQSALDLMTRLFRADGEDVKNGMLALATVAYNEKRRLQKVKRAKKERDGPAPPLPQLADLPQITVHKELWLAFYDSPIHSSGAALIIKSVAPFSHIEKLDRYHGAWSHDGLDEAVKQEAWISGVRAINFGIQASRENFSRVIERTSASPASVRRLWSEPDVPKAITTLLLSPSEDIHLPMVSLIQQSFDDVDDRRDCFRALLSKYPCQAMDGLSDFLTSFVQTASITPESCSLAKRLVRCFTDILEALCQPSADGDVLLQNEHFLEANHYGRNMHRRISDLWSQMTTSLAVIFKRTQDWAPLFDNETMVDWMRDALIFGRQMTEQIRAFEGAVLGKTGVKTDDKVPESPLKMTSVGRSLVGQLEMVLRDLVSWLRLTDLETLHQAFELVKTIVMRISKFTSSLKEAAELEATLYEIDKFSRRAGARYRTKLSDDLLSELADLLVPFNLDISEEDEVQYIKSEPSNTAASKAIPSKSIESGKTTGFKNAFDEMMRKASGGKPPSKSVKPSTEVKRPVTNSAVDEFDDDDFLSNLSGSDFALIEKGVKLPSKSRPIAQSSTSKLPQQSTSVTPQVKPPTAGKVNIVPKPTGAKPAGGSVFKSRVMQDIRREHRQHIVERKREIGGIVPRLPAASVLGSGLGAYQGPRRPIQPVVSSGSSSSDSSDDEHATGVSALVTKQKSPVRFVAAKPTERRQVKILGPTMADMYQQREDRRASQHAIKMRLKPDMNVLYRHILAWDPNSATLPPTVSLGPVPTTFPNSERYEQLMLPLFLQELWAQSSQDKAVAIEIPVEVTTRNYEDDFIDMDLTVQGRIPPDFFVNDADIALLRTKDSPSILAKVQAFRKRFKDTALKIRVLGKQDQQFLSMRAKLLLRKHISLGTAAREFAALRGLPYYDAPLLSKVLSAESAVMPRLSAVAIEDAQRAYDVNEPQARAILGSMSIQGFALIQGPPGTGKTKTISGLVGKFLSERVTVIPAAGEKPKKTKLLVCAPSNAAIDEVCKRLMNGVPSSSGGRHIPIIVRIGIEASVNIAVKDVALDSLVEARVNADTSGRGGDGDYTRLQGELDEVKQLIRAKQDELKAVEGNDEKRRAVENEYHGLITKRTQLGQKSSKAKDAARDATRHLEGARRAARDAILNEADIICATLSGAGQDTLSPYTFETVIIDEAAQAIEMSCLIPLKYGCKRCIMVGDPNQLPPTTFSTEAERFHYNQSLFVRMTKRSTANIQLLSIQYRMHPNISELPSKVFYDGQLKDGPDMAKKTAAVWHARYAFGPYRFFNVTGTEIKAGTSTKNPQEALVGVELYRRLEADFGSKVNLALRIGVISMYKEQLWELKRKFNEAFGAGILERIEFNTVDGFQGQEKDIIILSCVRSGPNLKAIGFLKDPRRMNVALTRAKSSLFIIGNGPTLERGDERWKGIVGDARERGFFIDYTPSTFAPEAEPIPKKVKKPSSPMAKASIHSSASKAIDAARLASIQNAAIDTVKPNFTEAVKQKRKFDAEMSPVNEKKLRVDDRHVPMASPKIPHDQTGRPGTNGANGSSVKPSMSVTRPGPPPAPKSIVPPPRPAEEVLFIKKKKKPKPNASIGQNVRSAINEVPQHRP